MCDANATSQVMGDEKVRLTSSAAVTSHSAGKPAGSLPAYQETPNLAATEPSAGQSRNNRSNAVRLALALDSHPFLRSIARVAIIKLHYTGLKQTSSKDATRTHPSYMHQIVRYGRSRNCVLFIVTSSSSSSSSLALLVSVSKVAERRWKGKSRSCRARPAARIRFPW